MDTSAAQQPSAGDVAVPALAPSAPPKVRRQSSSAQSEDSQTAADFIRDQMQLEADAREALPYKIDNCTKPLGALRQSVFACLTCNPPPADPKAPYDNAAGVCYACSVQCHGEHTLVEIFTKRNFTCDCGTTRLPKTSPCTLRLNPTTNIRGDVHSEEADANNRYNQNFRNRFCGCECDYDPFQQKGTMFQCLGLGTHETGGCGEDWWHPGCLVGLGPNWYEKMEATKPANGEVNPKAEVTTDNGTLETISEEATAPPEQRVPEEQQDPEDEELPPPPGFPAEDDFEGFLCYKCVEAFPWIKRYAGAPGFLPPIYFRPEQNADATQIPPAPVGIPQEKSSKKRKADDEVEESQDSKRQRSEDGPSPVDTKPDNATPEAAGAQTSPSSCKLDSLPPAPEGRFSLFFQEGFRENICHCSSCFPLLVPHPQLVEEEETYEPPVSEDGSENGGSTHGSGSLLDRGESALRNVDRVRAIEGVMAYNHLKDKLKPFFQQFAESGQAISAEDIKQYFAKLRGDEQPAQASGEDAGTDHRQEQSGY
ncbi:putative zinc finger in N-recognin-domain-containing protein [Coniochaeta sp. 2T2.1]|nr:putative zinc finger in N-recognin-domain-containing protein [Coniochaeta sp. 2T2.1]